MDNYRTLRFRQLERFDYGPEECLQFHDSIEKVVLPLIRERTERRREQMGLDKLRPWDSAVDQLCPLLQRTKRRAAKRVNGTVPRAKFVETHLLTATLGALTDQRQHYFFDGIVKLEALFRSIIEALQLAESQGPHLPVCRLHS